MSILRTIRDLFLPAPRSLRNKPGGMAWIKPYGQDYGAAAIAGQIVKTVKVASDGMWSVEPEPSYVLTAAITYEGRSYPAGARVRVVGIDDDLLEPLKNPGMGERCESTLWLPPVPTRSKETA